MRMQKTQHNDDDTHVDLTVNAGFFIASKKNSALQLEELHFLFPQFNASQNEYEEQISAVSVQMCL